MCSTALIYKSVRNSKSATNQRIFVVWSKFVWECPQFAWTSWHIVCWHDISIDVNIIVTATNFCCHFESITFWFWDSAPFVHIQKYDATKRSKSGLLHQCNTENMVSISHICQCNMCVDMIWVPVNKMNWDFYNSLSRGVVHLECTYIKPAVDWRLKKMLAKSTTQMQMCFWLLDNNKT